MDEINNNQNPNPQEPQENPYVQQPQENPYIQQPQEPTYVQPMANDSNNMQQYQQIPPQAPYQYDYYQEQNTPKGGNGMAIAAMIFGIASVVLCCTVFLSIPCSIVAIILSIICISKKKNGKAMAIAGLVCGIIGLLATIGIIAYIIAIYGALADYFGLSIPEFLKEVGSGNISQEEVQQAAQEIASQMAQ